MTKVNPNNRHETKSELIPWFILKFEINFYWSQISKSFQWL